MTNVDRITGSARNWYVLHVRSRFEKAVFATLESKGVAVFLPLYRSRRRWSQRVVEIDLPLFPGYIFCSFDPAKCEIPILTTPGIRGLVRYGGSPAPVETGELETIRQVLKTGVATEPWKHLATGQRVRVEYGALAGLEGIFITAKNTHRLLISVTLLQRSVAVEIDSACVSRISPACRAPSPTAFAVS